MSRFTAKTHKQFGNSDKSSQVKCACDYCDVSAAKTSRHCSGACAKGYCKHPTKPVQAKICACDYCDVAAAKTSQHCSGACAKGYCKHPTKPTQVKICACEYCDKTTYKTSQHCSRACAEGNCKHDNKAAKDKVVKQVTTQCPELEDVFCLNECRCPTCNFCVIGKNCYVAHVSETVQHDDDEFGIETFDVYFCVCDDVIPVIDSYANWLMTENIPLSNVISVEQIY